MSKVEKAKIGFSPNVINQMGANAYTVPSAVSEILANSLDTEAKNILIEIDENKKTLLIKDDGSGMSMNIVQNYFLVMASSKRESKKFGNKGIGKLAIFAIGKKAHISTSDGKGEKIEFEINMNDVEKFKTIDEYRLILEQNIYPGKSYTEITISEFIKQKWSDMDSIIKNITRSFGFWDGAAKVKIIVKKIDNFKKIEEKELLFEEPDFNKSLIYFSLSNNDNINNKLQPPLTSEQKEFLKNNHNYSFSLNSNWNKTKEILLKSINEKRNKNKFQCVDDLILTEDWPKMDLLLSNGVDKKKIDLDIYGKIFARNNVINNDATESINDKVIKINNSRNAISITVNGRLVVENIIPILEERNLISERFYKSYLSGNIEASFISKIIGNDEFIDPIKNNRDGITGDDPRFTFILTIAAILIREIFTKFTNNYNRVKEIRHKNARDLRKKISDNLISKQIISHKEQKTFEKIISPVALEKIMNNGKFEDKYIFVSYRSYDKLIIENFIASFRDLTKDHGVKILFTGSSVDSERPEGSYLYEHIKDQLMSDVFTHTVMLNFMTVENPLDERDRRGYKHNWNTAIEFGMGYQVLGNKNLFSFAARKLTLEEFYTTNPMGNISPCINRVGFDEAGVTQHLKVIFQKLGIEKNDELAIIAINNYKKSLES